MASIIKVDTIQTSSGGTQWFTNPPRFHLRKNTTQSLTEETFATVTWNVADVDSESGWDQANNQWVVPAGQGGSYYLYATIASDAGNSTDLRDHFITIQRYNGSSWVGLFHAGDRFSANDVEGGTVSAHGVADLSAGDYLRVRAMINTVDGSGAQLIAAAFDGWGWGDSYGADMEERMTVFGGYRIA